jgi:hypothetical protein
MVLEAVVGYCGGIGIGIGIGMCGATLDTA